MQTFLPSENFFISAEALDDKRLGNQRKECLQILKTLAIGPYQMWREDEWKPCSQATYQIQHALNKKFVRKTPWYNHPAVQMWRGFECTLVNYGYVICTTWKDRGFKDTIGDNLDKIHGPLCKAIYDRPPFLGDEAFHASHRSNLIRKFPQHYRDKLGWTEPDDLPYVWPTKEERFKKYYQ